MDTYIPGDCLPGLLDGWTGPAETWVRPGVASFSGHWAQTVVFCGGEYPCRTPGEREIRLDTRREEVRDRVARVLARVLGVPVGATAPRFFLPDECLAWVLSKGSGRMPHIFGSTDYLGPHPGRHTVPELAELPLDSPDRDAFALAIIARHVGTTLCP